MMTEERRKEIALELIEAKILERGFPGSGELRREVGNMAQKINVTTDELMEFYKSCAPKLLSAIFGIDTTKK